MAGGPILIVEDNAVNALILRSMLRKYGYEPMVATDGLQGVELAERHRPRLVLMDLQMPGLDGIAAAERIHRVCGTETVIVAITASADEEEKGACATAGFAGLLHKPVDLNELIATVRSWVGEP